MFASRTNALATLAKSHPAACLPSSRCSSRPPRGRPLGTPERCNSLTKLLSNNRHIIYDLYIATQEPAPENPGVTYIIQCIFYYIYVLDILLPPGPHLHTPNPLSTPERGLCRGPPPHPGSPSISQPFNDSRIFVLLINISLSTRNIIHLTIYYNTLSASYKRYSEKFATLRKIFARRDAQKFFKATLNFSKPPHLQLSANATNSAYSMEFWFTLFTVI